MEGFGCCCCFLQLWPARHGRDTLYDFSIQIDPDKFIPILRRCAMLEVLDKDWNMLGGWEDILKGVEAKCCSGVSVTRLPSDQVLHETTTILRNARNSMQCKFFSVRFMRYTEDQAPQRWRYFPKCSAPACANIETHARLPPYTPLPKMLVFSLLQSLLSRIL